MVIIPEGGCCGVRCRVIKIFPSAKLGTRTFTIRPGPVVVNKEEVIDLMCGLNLNQMASALIICANN